MRPTSVGDPGACILAFDFGLRRIGVAVGTRKPVSASALATCAARNGLPDWPTMDALIAEWQPALIVVGIPHRADGSEGDMAAPARDFAASMGERYALGVEFVDESFTSRTAREELRDKRGTGLLRRRVKRGDADRIAARLVLESWLSRASA